MGRGWRAGLVPLVWASVLVGSMGCGRLGYALHERDATTVDAGTVDAGDGEIDGGEPTDAGSPPDATTDAGRASLAFGAAHKLMGMDALFVRSAGPGLTYVAGQATSDPLDLGDGLILGATRTTGVIARFDDLGSLVWFHTFTPSAGENVDPQISVDSSGNVVASVWFSGTLDVPDGPSLVSAGTTDVAVLSYDAAGALRWHLRLGAEGPEGVSAVGVDSVGNVFTTGHLSGTVEFGSRSLTATAVGTNFIASYDSAGEPRWARLLPFSRSLAPDGMGGVVVSGFLEGGRTFDFGRGTATAVGQNAYVAAYGADGTSRWAHLIPATVSDGRLVATDDSGNVFLAGEFEGEIRFGSTLLSGDARTGFLASYDSDGFDRWAVSLPVALVYNDLITDASENVLLAGNFNGEVDFGGRPLRAPTEWADGFLAAYGPDGAPVYSYGLHGSSIESGYSLARAADGGLWMTAAVWSAAATAFGEPLVGADHVSYLLRLDPDSVP